MTISKKICCFSFLITYFFCAFYIAASIYPEEVIKNEVKAYNERNLEAFMATYHEEIKIYRFPDKLLYTGKKEMKKYYKELFEKAKNLKARIVNRLIMGNIIIDHEKVFGHIKTPELEAILIYQIKDGLIFRVWMISK
jgi:hypothetical protein